MRAGGYEIRPWLPLLCALVLGALLLPVRAAMADTACPEKALVFVAHEDDDIIFQNPALLERVAAGIAYAPSTSPPATPAKARPTGITAKKARGRPTR